MSATATSTMAPAPVMRQRAGEDRGRLGRRCLHLLRGGSHRRCRDRQHQSLQCCGPAAGPGRADRGDGFGYLKSAADDRFDGAHGDAVDGHHAFHRLQICLGGNIGNEGRQAVVVHLNRQRDLGGGEEGGQPDEGVRRAHPDGVDGGGHVGSQTSGRRFDRGRHAMHVDGHRLAVRGDGLRGERSSGLLRCHPADFHARDSGVPLDVAAGAQQVDQIDTDQQDGQHRSGNDRGNEAA